MAPDPVRDRAPEGAAEGRAGEDERDAERALLGAVPEREDVDQLNKMWIMPLKGKYLVWAITGTSRYLVLRGVDHDQRDTLVACCCQGFLLQGYDQGCHVWNRLFLLLPNYYISPSKPPIDRSRQPVWKGFQPS